MAQTDLSITDVRRLSQLLASFDTKSTAQKRKLLKTFAKMNLQRASTLVAYHELLLFLLAYPDNSTIRSLAQKELERLAKLLLTRTDRTPHPPGWPAMSRGR